MMTRAIHSMPMIALFLMASAVPAAAQDSAGTSTGTSTGTAASANTAQPGDIVVTGRSLADTAADLAACIARGCPPDQDVRATLAHAENQFVSGDYRDARGTMLASLRRNRNAGGQFPVEVSDLQRANARVAAHLGERNAYQLATLDSRDTLRAALTENDPRVMIANIEVADSRARLGYPDEARGSYARIAEQAEAAGQPRVAAFAKIRLAAANLPSNPSMRQPRRVEQSISSLTQIAGNGPSVGQDMALMAEVMLARYERENGNMARTEALVRRFQSGEGSARPLLLSSDPIRLHDAELTQERGSSGNVLQRMQTVNVNRRYVDIGYWINSDGRVSDYEILRHSGGTEWAEAVERSVKSRIYAPLQSVDGQRSQGFYIVERYSLTADINDSNCTGSHVRCRSPQLRVERMDLTPEDLSDQPDRPVPVAGATATPATN